jgi:hypothetical protein
MFEPRPLECPRQWIFRGFFQSLREISGHSPKWDNDLFLPVPCSLDIRRILPGKLYGLVSKLSGLWTGRFRVPFPAGAKDFLSSKYPYGLWSQTASIQWVPGGYFHGLKQPELDVSHSPPSNAQVKNYRHYTSTPVDRDSSVGIATRYGLDGPVIESRWGRDIPHPFRPAWGLPSLLYNGYLVFPQGKAAGAWRWPPTPI